MSDLERRMQDQSTVFDGKFMEPGDREVAVTQAEHRIRMVVLKDADETWKSHKEREEGTSNNIEALRSDVVRLSAKNG